MRAIRGTLSRSQQHSSVGGISGFFAFRLYSSTVSIHIFTSKELYSYMKARKANIVTDPEVVNVLTFIGVKRSTN
jgi:hypothetical protein